MLTPTKKILQHAQKHGYAVGAFNVNNMEIAQAIIDAAESEKSPVIIQTSEGGIKYAGMDVLIAMITTMAEKVSVPVALHLDHGKNEELILQAIRSGYQSVMFDGSDLPVQKNIAITKRIVQQAHKHKVTVEAEIGAIQGIEDFISVDEKDANLTGPEEAKTFVQKTNCDFLAIAIGTAHGAYKFSKKSALDFKRLEAIRALVNVPLVLHGASSVPKTLVKRIKKFGGNLGDPKGVSDKHLTKAVAGGICKVNTDTDIRLAFTSGIREVLHKKPQEFDPRKVLAPAYDEMLTVIRWKMHLLGSSNKA